MAQALENNGQSSFQLKKNRVYKINVSVFWGKMFLDLKM